MSTMIKVEQKNLFVEAAGIVWSLDQHLMMRRWEAINNGEGSTGSVSKGEEIYILSD